MAKLIYSVIASADGYVEDATGSAARVTGAPPVALGCLQQDTVMTVATIATQPDRHAPVMADCECGMCAPTWALRRGK